MNTIKKYTEKELSLRIKKKDINSNGEIFPHILLNLLETALQNPVEIMEYNYDIKATRSSCVYKVDIIGKAIPGDELRVHTQLGTFNNHTAVFNIQIMNKNKKNRQKPICKASFSYKLENNTVIDKIAS